MKRLGQVLFLLGLALCFSAAAMAYTGTYPAGAGLNGTPHDLGSVHNGMDYTAVPSDPLTRICVYCHAPHNAYRFNGLAVGAGPNAPFAAFDYLPLWNHTLQSNISYTLYDPGNDPLVGWKHSQATDLATTVNNVSLLCLSCHDGSVAVNNYGNADQPSNPQMPSQSTGNTLISSQYLIGKDRYLGNHHPIGFDYDTVQSQDGEIRQADTYFMTPGKFIRDYLYNGELQCASCHSVHNKGNTGERLLWRSDQNSELCITCHDKAQYVAP